MSRILMIDDNKYFLEMMASYLTSEGYKVRTLSDPNRTEAYVDEFNPSLMIIDVFMPERSGFNIVEDFSEKGVYQNIPKIFLTGLDDDIEKMTAKGIGVKEYLTKPIMPSELSEVIEKMLNPPVEGVLQ